MFDKNYLNQYESAVFEIIAFFSGILPTLQRFSIEVEPTPPCRQNGEIAPT